MLACLLTTPRIHTALKSTHALGENAMYHVFMYAMMLQLTEMYSAGMGLGELYRDQSKSLAAGQVVHTALQKNTRTCIAVTVSTLQSLFTRDCTLAPAVAGQSCSLTLAWPQQGLG